jgi:hypothetical protein
MVAPSPTSWSLLWCSWLVMFLFQIQSVQNNRQVRRFRLYTQVSKILEVQDVGTREDWVSNGLDTKVTMAVLWCVCSWGGPRSAFRTAKALLTSWTSSCDWQLQ